MRNLFFILLCATLFSKHVFGEETCQSLFSRHQLSNDQMNNAINELYKLRRTALSSNKNEALIAQRLFNDKLSELKQVMTTSEIKEKLKLANIENISKKDDNEAKDSGVESTKTIISDIFAIDYLASKLVDRSSYFNLDKDRELAEIVSFLKAASPAQYNSIVNQLRRVNLDLEDKDHLLFTVLHLAAELAPIEITKLLIDIGADMYAEEDAGLTPLLRMKGKVDDRAAMFFDKGFTIPQKNNKKYLLWSVKNNCKKVFQLYLDGKYDVNVSDSNQSTALHIAARYGGRKHYIKLLVAAGANINARDVSGNTPLGEALGHNKAKTADLLRSLGGHE